MKLTGKLSGLVLGAMTMVMASLIGCSNGSDSTLPVPTGSGESTPTETIMGEGELTWSGLEITNYTKYAKAGAKIHLDVTKRKDGDAEYCKVLILDKDWGDSGVTEAYEEGSTEKKIKFETEADGQPCNRPYMEGEGQYYFVLNEAACAKPTLSLFGNATVKKITIEYVGGKKEGNKQPEGGEFDRGLASELSNDMHIFNETGAGTIEAESVRKAKINITNVGTANWHVQFTNDITGAAVGDVYTISFKMKSEKARKVAWQVAGGTTGYDYMDGETLTFTEGEDKTVSKDVTINLVPPAKFQINMEKQEGEDTPAGYIILEDVSIIKKSSGSGSGEPGFTEKTSIIGGIQTGDDVWGSGASLVENDGVYTGTAAAADAGSWGGNLAVIIAMFDAGALNGYTHTVVDMDLTGYSLSGDNEQYPSIELKVGTEASTKMVNATSMYDSTKKALTVAFPSDANLAEADRIQITIRGTGTFTLTDISKAK